MKSLIATVFRDEVDEKRARESLEGNGKIVKLGDEEMEEGADAKETIAISEGNGISTSYKNFL